MNVLEVGIAQTPGKVQSSNLLLKDGRRLLGLYGEPRQAGPWFTESFSAGVEEAATESIGSWGARNAANRSKEILERTHEDLEDLFDNKYSMYGAVVGVIHGNRIGIARRNMGETIYFHQDTNQLPDNLFGDLKSSRTEKSTYAVARRAAGYLVLSASAELRTSTAFDLARMLTSEKASAQSMAKELRDYINPRDPLNSAVAVARFSEA